MSTNVLILILGLAFIAVLALLGVLILRGRRSADMQAGFEAGAVKFSLKLSQQTRSAVDEHLRAASASKGQRGGEAEARERLANIELIQHGRVLWVDDHPDYNVEETLMLNALGLATTQATSTDAALRYLAGQAFDLLITDLGRDGNPDAGLELLAAIRASPLPKLVYTFTPGDREQQAKDLGAATVVETPAELLTAVLGEFAKV